jgi:hypothetical protein
VLSHVLPDLAQKDRGPFLHPWKEGDHRLWVGPLLPERTPLTDADAVEWTDDGAPLRR